MKVLSRPACKGSHGVLQTLGLYIDYTDKATDGVAKVTTFGDEVLPPGAIVVDCWHQVLQAFNGGTTNVITVGDDNTADRFKAAGDIDEATPGAPISLVSGYQATVARTPQVSYTFTGTTPTTGKLVVFIDFIEAELMP